jgi:Spy/CpxP family protein refolding chaperone
MLALKKILGEIIMKNIFLFLCACSFLFSVGVANAEPPRRDDRPMDWSGKLDFTDQQKIQYKEITAKSQEKIRDLMEKIEDLHKQISEIRAQDEAEMVKILNEKQKIKYEKIRSRQNKNKRPDEGDRPEGMKKSLSKRMRVY